MKYLIPGVLTEVGVCDVWQISGYSVAVRFAPVLDRT